MNEGPPITPSTGSVLIIGHVCYDLRDGKKLIGGPPMYQIPVFLNLGYDVDVLTSYNDSFDFPKHDRLKIYNIESRHTTFFNYKKPQIIKKNKDVDRLLFLSHKAANLEMNEEMKRRLSSYDIIIISAIAKEVSSKLIDYISKNINSNKTLIGIDMQGITRIISTDGLIRTRKLSDVRLIKLLSKVSIIKGSSSELKELSEIKKAFENLDDRKNILIRTNSGKSLDYFFNKKIQSLNIDHIAEDQIIDSTGSGDIFFASFCAIYFSTKNVSYSLLEAHKITKAHLYINGIPTLEETQKILNILN